MRADGLCAHCHGPRLQRLPKVITQRSRAELIDNLTADPFCSVACCRDYHDTPTTLNLGRPRAALA